MLSTPIAPQTDDALLYTNKPLPLTNAYNAMETDDVNINNCNLLCVSRWGECMFYPCLVQTLMFGNMSTHVDTNR